MGSREHGSGRNDPATSGGTVRPDTTRGGPERSDTTRGGPDPDPPPFYEVWQFEQALEGLELLRAGPTVSKIVADWMDEMTKALKGGKEDPFNLTARTVMQHLERESLVPGK